MILCERDPDSWWESLSETLNHEFNRKLFKFPAKISLKLTGMFYSLSVLEKAKDSLSIGLNVSNVFKVHTKILFKSEITENCHCQDHKTSAESRTFYENWTEEVKSIVEPEDLLVLRAKDGWGPLCKFLKQPVPKDMAYPMENAAESTRKMFKTWLNNQYYLFFCYCFWFPVIIGVFLFKAFTWADSGVKSEL